MRQSPPKWKSTLVLILDFLVDFPIIGALIALVVSGLLTWPYSDFGNPIQVTSLKSAASVAFALFGFAIAAVSILAALKTTPFLAAAAKENFKVFKMTVDHFIKTAIVLFLWGLFGLFLPESTLLLTPRPIYINFVLFAYGFFMILSLYLSLSSAYLLRLLVVAEKE